MTTFVEREHTSGDVTSQNWQAITREDWQEQTLEGSVLIPLCWSLMRGAAVTVAALSLSAAAAAVVSHNALIAIPAASLAVGCAVVAVTVNSDISTARETPVHREVYDGGGVKMQSAQRDTARAQTVVEVVTLANTESISETQTEGHYSNLRSGDKRERWPLPQDDKTMLAVYNAVDSGAAQWSANSISNVPGVSQSIASELIAFMLNAGMLYRESAHSPRGAELTASGRAMFKTLRQRHSDVALT